MKLSTFKKVFAAAVHHASVALGRSEFKVGEILDLYTLTLNPIWPQSLLKDMEYDGLLEFRRHLGPVREQYVSMSPQGIEWVEDDIGENLSAYLEQNGAVYSPAPPSDVPQGVLLTEDGEPLMTEDGQYFEIEEQIDETSVTIDSSAWTGLTEVVINARNAQVVSGLIDQALTGLSASAATNFEIMQATAYLKAAKELIDAPEPPSHEIWSFVGRAADLVGLVGFFYTIFAQALK